MFCVQHPLVLPCLGVMLVQCSAIHDARALGRCPSLAGLAFYIYPWLFTGCIVCCIYHAIHATTAGEIAAHMSAFFLLYAGMLRPCHTRCSVLGLKLCVLRVAMCLSTVSLVSCLSLASSLSPQQTFPVMHIAAERQGSA